MNDKCQALVILSAGGEYKELVQLSVILSGGDADTKMSQFIRKNSLKLNLYERIDIAI